MLTLEEAELETGETVYSVIEMDGDTVSFAGYCVIDTVHNGRDEGSIVFDGEGAVFRDSLIQGVTSDGTERIINIDSVAVVELERFDLARTIFIPIVAAVEVVVDIMVNLSSGCGCF
jgi:hypothetical protein